MSGQYGGAVGNRLPLPAAQRRQLLTGLREELTESAPDCTTLDALIAHVGTPDEAAQELLSGIAPERVQAYQKKLHRRYLLAAVLIVVIVCCAALIYAQVQKSFPEAAPEMLDAVPGMADELRRPMMLILKARKPRRSGREQE